jgi:hypothetical protein
MAQEAVTKITPPFSSRMKPQPGLMYPYILHPDTAISIFTHLKGTGVARSTSRTAQLLTVWGHLVSFPSR